MNIPVKDASWELQRERAISDILEVYRSDRFTNVKNNTLRTIEILFELGYYKDSESLLLKEN